MDGRGRRGGGLAVPVSLAVLCALVVGGFAVHFRGYYGASVVMRRQLALHAVLRPAGLVGLGFGVGAGLMVVWNVAYLIHRSKVGRRVMPGGRRGWMNWHVFTGLAAAPLALIHSSFVVRNSVGGHALVVLGVVVISGIAGRVYLARLAGFAHTGHGGFSSWRLVHRWLALLLVLLVVIHVGVSLRYGSFDLIQDRAAKGVRR